MDVGADLRFFVFVCVLGGGEGVNSSSSSPRLSSLSSSSLMTAVAFGFLAAGAVFGKGDGSPKSISMSESTRSSNSTSDFCGVGLGRFLEEEGPPAEEGVAESFLRPLAAVNGDGVDPVLDFFFAGVVFSSRLLLAVEVGRQGGGTTGG